MVERRSLRLKLNSGAQMAVGKRVHPCPVMIRAGGEAGALIKLLVLRSRAIALFCDIYNPCGNNADGAWIHI
jgi:hypothetical protein